MITIDNYFTEVERIGLNNFPPAYKKSHEFVIKTSENGSNWSIYHSNAIVRKTIDLYFSLASNFISTYESDKGKKSKSFQKIKQATVRRSKKTSKANITGQPFKKVRHLRDEIKFIKRYVGLHNKIKTPSAILSLLKGLQRSIVQKLISKTSPLADEIEMIQNKLVAAYNTMRKPERFEINEKDLGRLVAVAGGEEVYVSVKFIKRFIGMQDKDLTTAQVESFTNQLKNAVDKKKILKEDPYADWLNAIYKKLKTNSGKISLSKSDLNGLEGIVKACACRKDLAGIVGAGTRKSLPKGVLTAEEMANRKQDLLDFSSTWFDLFGKPAKNFTMMVHGEPFNGKTIFLLKYAKYLAENFGDVLYVSSEEFSSETMTKKIKEFLTPFPSRLHFSEHLVNPISDYKFIIFDSINDLGLTIAELKDMRKKHPQMAFIFILQHTKTGKFKGGKDWEHLAEIVGEVSNGTLTTTKNRYAHKSSLKFLTMSGEVGSVPISPRPYPVMQ